MYPAFVILVVIVVIFIMMIKVVPNLLEIFESKETLPASTQVLIAMSNFFVGYWWLMALFIFLAVS
jgi:type II secretory pathway component PulF